VYEYGLLQVRLGQTEEGLDLLRRAVEQAPADADALAKLAKGLRLSGRTEEAGAALRAALFRNPRLPRFRKLWNEFHFTQLRQKQEGERVRRAAARRQEAPIILPFVRPVAQPSAETDEPRTDEPATVSPPHRLRLAPRTDQRHVQ
jgi:tetratricopeptide (TPR) repeat protein